MEFKATIAAHNKKGIYSKHNEVSQKHNNASENTTEFSKNIAFHKTQWHHNDFVVFTEQWLCYYPSGPPYFWPPLRRARQRQIDGVIYCTQSGAPCNALNSPPPQFRFPTVTLPPSPSPFVSLLVWMRLTPESPAVCALPSSVSAFYDCYLHLVERSV